MYSAFPLIRKYLDGVCASSANEARLGREEFGKEVHTSGAAYKEEDFQTIMRCSDYIIFNSLDQWEKEKEFLEDTDHQFGLRINLNKIKIFFSLKEIFK